ncbi:MAG: FecR domain-containing protein [Bdellovibrionota bacterium]
MKITLKIAFLGALVGFSSQSRAAVHPAGRAVKIVGEVSRYGDSKKSQPFAVGDSFFVGDIIETGPSGRVKLIMNEGGNEVVVGSSTRLVIERTGLQARGETAGTSLVLQQGQVRSVVNKKYSGIGQDVFEVKTPNAVAGVRGTIFLVSFDQKQFRSLLATERGSVIWQSQGKEILVNKGKFSTVIGKEILMPTAIESSPAVSSEVEAAKTEASHEGAALDSSANSSVSQSTSIDADGNEVVVEKTPQSSGLGGRAPASVSDEVASTDAAPAASANARTTMGSKEQKLALAKVSEGGAPQVQNAVSAPGDILKGQQNLSEQTGFVKRNASRLNPAVVAVPLK